MEKGFTDMTKESTHSGDETGIIFSQCKQGLWLEFMAFLLRSIKIIIIFMIIVVNVSLCGTLH